MSNNTQAFDEWLRTRFVEINSQLEAIYWQQEDKANVEFVGEQFKHQFVSY